MEIKVTKKICSCCRGDIPLEDFYPSDTGLFGVLSICKVCGSFKNHNLSRKTKGLAPLSIEEYRIYKKTNTLKKRKESANHLRDMGKKIEALFKIRWEKANLAHREKWFKDNFNKLPPC